MPGKIPLKSIRRVDVQVSIFTAVVVILSCFSVFFFHYRLTYHTMIAGLTDRVSSIHDYVETFLSAEYFSEITCPADMDTPLYRKAQEQLYSIKQATGVMYFYTATQTADGSFIYVVDGLSPTAEDFRRPGDLIEPEIIPELQRAMSGEDVLPDEIKPTAWGKIFIAYLPIHDGDEVVGVLGIEFEADYQYDTYRALRIATPQIVLVACLLAAVFAVVFFRRISNPSYQDMANTDHLTQLKNRNAFETDMKNIDALRGQKATGLLVIDLNNLKVVNDTLGHEAGDLYLQTVARAIRESVPVKAVSYRVGGDEFVLLIRNSSPAELQKLTNGIRARFQALIQADWPEYLSFSAGGAVYQSSDQTIYATYRRADAEMYIEKDRYHKSRKP